jgi:thiosulfate/3-mercaptopyruvate sulfurtransferase
VRQERHFTARLQTMMVRDRDDVASASSTGSAQIVDARASARFAGAAPEPRPGLRAGHIPNSHNVPYDLLLGPDKTLKSADEIRAIFEAAGVDMAKPMVTTCGSGVTAAVLSLGLAVNGRLDTGLYDGSWTEWGGDPSLPIETGDRT